jgi:hypothetical protein
MRAERRRSERIMFSIPVDVCGTDEEGVPFCAGGRTITLNRHGARVQIARLLQIGQIVQIMNMNSEAAAQFRVVGPLSPPAEKVGEWGVENLHPDENIWGIRFPAPDLEAEVKAVLECRECHTAVLTPLNLVELEVIETTGLLNRACEVCAGVSLWGLPEQQVVAEGTAVLGFPAPTPDLRTALRSTMQVSARLRDFYGGMEVVRTEDVSKEGLRFTSEKDYHLGQGVMVVCPYDETALSQEVRARIVRKEPLAGTSRLIYGLALDYKPA